MKISINLVKILGKQFVIDNFMQILYIEKQTEYRQKKLEIEIEKRKKPQQFHRQNNLDHSYTIPKKYRKIVPDTEEKIQYTCFCKRKNMKLKSRTEQIKIDTFQAKLILNSLVYLSKNNKPNYKDVKKIKM